jgi:hypothetical protein
VLRQAMRSAARERGLRKIEAVRLTFASNFARNSKLR